ncbi:MAG TPA: VTT domain-containing protein [Verrucomicrobiae bacterium]|nr:VTT domain-containing protein [Verrucomicrobiae bacterium]
MIELLTTFFSGFLAYIFLFFIVFAETGLLIGFFLPGDSLLFTVGVVAGAGELNIWLINIVLIVAAIIGDSVGYALGRMTGEKIFNRPDSLLFKKDHLDRTRTFYEKHGGKTIIYARFIPIIRTFAPFIAGVANMNYKHFIAYNVFGGIGWVLLMTTLGYVLGNVPIVRENFEKVILGIIFISLLPPIIEGYKQWRTGKKIA